MENKIISIDIFPENSTEHSVNAGVMWEHNATVIEFNIDEAYVGDYRYYIEYRSLMGTRVRTQYLELDTETNTVTYSIPVSMSSLKGVECWFNIVSIDGDGNTQQIIKASKFCLTFDYSPDTDNQLCKVNDFSINALLEAIRLETFKGDKGEKGDKGDKGDKGETGGISEEYAAENFANAIKGYAAGGCVAINDASPTAHPIKVKVKRKNLWNCGDVTVTHKYYLSTLNCTLPAGKTYTLTADIESTDTDAEQCIVINRTNNNEILGYLGRGDRQTLTFTLKGDCKEFELYASEDYENSVGDTATFKNIQLEEGTEATEYTPYVEPSNMVVVKYGKNLLPYPYEETTKTENGITFTDNGDGTITVDGTATANVTFTLCSRGTLPAAVYSLSGTPSGGSGSTYFMEINVKGLSSLTDYGSGGTIDYSSSENSLTITKAYIRIMSGTTVKNLVFKPCGYHSDNTAEFEPYIPPEFYTANNDGVIEDIVSDEKNITLVSVKKGATIHCEYNKDTNKVIEKLVNAIISLGGNV